MYPQQKKALYMRPRHLSKPGFSNPFYKSQRPKKSKRFYYGLITLILTLIAWIYFLFFSNVFKVTDWEINGAKIYNKENVEGATQSFLEKSKFFIFRFSNIFVFNTKDFNKYLSQNYALENVKIKKYFPHKIIINLEEKTPKLAIYNKNKIYILAEDGTVVLKKEGIDSWFTTSEVTADNLSATGTVSGYTINIDKVLSDAKTKELPNYPTFCDAYYTKDLEVAGTYPAVKVLALINTFIAGLHEKTPIRAKLVALIKNQTNPKIVIYTENNWKIYLSNTDDGEKQFYKLSLVFQEQIKDLGKPLEYIDLRFGDKVYFK